MSARRSIGAVLAGLGLLFSGTAFAATPACVRENGCTIPACVGAPTGNVFYACDCNTTGSGAQQPQAGCVAGSDGNPGTSPATAWKTYGKMRTAFGALAAGDRILACDGGVFSNTVGGGSWVNFSATSGNRVALGHYTASWGGGGVRPKLMNDLGSYGLNLASGTETPKGGYVFYGLSVEGRGLPATPCASSSPSAMDGVFIYNQTNYVTLCDDAILSQCNGIEAGGGNTGGDVDTNVTLQYTYIEGNGGQGWLGGDPDYLIDSNWFDGNGFEAFNVNHNLYVGNGIRVTISNNEFTRNAHFGGGGCDGAVAVFHGIITDILIAGNYIHEVAGTALSPCYGFGINPGYTSQEEFLRVTVRDNVIQNVNGDAINMSACHNCVVENNIIQETAPGLSSAVVLSDDGTGSGGGDWHNDSTVMRNNIGWGQGASFNIVGVGTNMISANNFAFLTNTGTVSCFNYSLPNIDYTFINNNGCYAPSATTLNWNAAGPTSRATMCGNGFDCNSIQGSNPSFTNARLSLTYTGAGADFTPTSASPLIGAGTAAHASAADFFGVPWPNPPSIGAVLGVISVSAPRNTIFFFGGLCLLLALGFGAAVLKRRQIELAHRERHAQAVLEPEHVRELEARGDLLEVLNHPCKTCGEPLYVVRYPSVKAPPASRILPGGPPVYAFGHDADSDEHG